MNKFAGRSKSIAATTGSIGLDAKTTCSIGVGKKTTGSVGVDKKTAGSITVAETTSKNYNTYTEEEKVLVENKVRPQKKRRK